MDEDQFWSIIEAGGHDALDAPERQLAAVRAELSKLAPAEFRGFLHRYHAKLAEAYNWELWGAAYLINSGCSDDGFEYFRAWLISRGRVVYEAALADPDSLAGAVDPTRDDHEFEELGYLAPEVYEVLTGEEMAPIERPGSTEPKGSRWDFDDGEQVARRLPRLARLCPD